MKSMDVLGKLASSLGRKDEVPNQELAIEIVEASDKAAVAELVSHLNNKSKDIQNDCIKVLYEIGEKAPSLIAVYLSDFVRLLHHKNNRLQWGGMTAIYTIAGERTAEVFALLPEIVSAMESGSVITKDNGVKILITLCERNEYADKAFTLLNEQLLKSPVNQLPMYAELALPVINQQNKAAFVRTLTSRLAGIDKESKRKRIEKVIKKLS